MTSIYLHRWNLITKEEMESYCKGEESVKNSVNDDLESFCENIRLEKELDEFVVTYFLPMLPESVERRDTIQQTWNPDIWKSTDEKQLQVINNKMMHSESNSIYLKAMSTRKTFGIEIFSENSYEYSKRRKFI